MNNNNNNNTRANSNANSIELNQMEVANGYGTRRMATTMHKYVVTRNKIYILSVFIIVMQMND